MLAAFSRPLFCLKMPKKGTHVRERNAKLLKTRRRNKSTSMEFVKTDQQSRVNKRSRVEQTSLLAIFLFALFGTADGFRFLRFLFGLQLGFLCGGIVRLAVRDDTGADGCVAVANGESHTYTMTHDAQQTDGWMHEVLVHIQIGLPIQAVATFHILYYVGKLNSCVSSSIAPPSFNQNLTKKNVPMAVLPSRTTNPITATTHNAQHLIPSQYNDKLVVIQWSHRNAVVGNHWQC